MQGAPSTPQSAPPQTPTGGYQQQAYGAYQAPTGKFINLGFNLLFIRF